jgi:hypothetical protein
VFLAILDYYRCSLQFWIVIIIVAFSAGGIFDGALFFKLVGFGGSCAPTTEIVRARQTGSGGLLRECETSGKSLRSTADQGDSTAQLAIGICLWYVKGILRDSSAGEYLKRSAKQGNPDAESDYGYCLRKGKGIARNPIKAANIFKRFAAQGHPEGQKLKEIHLANIDMRWHVSTARPLRQMPRRGPEIPGRLRPMSDVRHWWENGFSS